jgi:hypothetical protein
MAQVRSWAGLDVHRASVVAATMDRDTGELGVRRLPGETREVVAFCAGLPGPTRVAYEAGPTGFALARALTAAGVGCVIAAPGKIERPSSDRVKTDQRDAERLLRLLMIDGLHAVRVPSTQEEALRDLVRAREDIRDLGPFLSASTEHLASRYLSDPVRLRKALPASLGGLLGRVMSKSSAVAQLAERIIASGTSRRVMGLVWAVLWALVRGAARFTQNMCTSTPSRGASEFELSPNDTTTKSLDSSF